MNQSAGLDTYIDAVRSEGKFAVVVEEEEETAAAAERDLVVRVEEKVERLEEKLGGKGSASASAPGGDDVSGTPPSTAPTSARSPAAAAFTGADAKPAPAVRASAERSSPSEAAKSVEATDARGTEKLEKSEKSARSSAARTATETAPASGESKPDAGKRATMPDPTASERPQPQPRPQQPAVATTATAADAAIKKSTTSPGASKAEAQRTSEAAAIAAYETATTSSLAPKPAADAASTKAAAAAVAKSVSKESSSRESPPASSSASAVEALSGLEDDATKLEVEELKAIVKDAAAGEATPTTPAATTISNAKTRAAAAAGAAAGAEKAKEKAPERPAAVKSEGRTGTTAEKESAAPAAPPTKVDKDVASNAVPVSKESSPKESPKEVSRERAPTEAAPKKEKVDLEEKAAARIEEKSSKRNGDADKVKAPAAPSAPAAPAAAAASKDKPASKDKAKTASAASEVSGKSVSGSAPVKNQPPTRPTPATPTAEVVRPEPGWWRPLFYFAAIPAAAQAAGALSGVAVESPVWLLGPEGCAMESRRSLAKLLGIRGRAAVRWQEAVAGSGVVIGMGKQGRVFASVDDDDDDDEETELDADGNLCAKCSFDPDESEAAVNTWGALFTEQRNRYLMIIGVGVCLLAGLSNTVIYHASGAQGVWSRRPGP